jgi:hypothetical protein
MRVNLLTAAYAPTFVPGWRKFAAELRVRSPRRESALAELMSLKSPIEPFT